MPSGHTHSLPETRNERSLLLALALTGSFLIAEVIGGIVTGSLALISDVAHMFTDVAALAIALAAIRVGRRPPDSRRTFGYQRFEILAAAFNAVLLFLVAIYILYEAYQRLKIPPEIQPLGMLVIATIGLAINLISIRLLTAGRDTSLNVKGAYLEVWSDLLGSVGVIAGALVIAVTDWLWVDSVIAVAIGLWVLPRTWVLLKESLNILLEGVPEGVDLDLVSREIREVPGVTDMHDLHVWAITNGRTSISAHVVVNTEADAENEIVPTIRQRLADRFRITHVTLQCEHAPCTDSADGCRLTGPDHTSGAEDTRHIHLPQPDKLSQSSQQ